MCIHKIVCTFVSVCEFVGPRLCLFEWLNDFSIKSGGALSKDMLKDRQ